MDGIKVLCVIRYQLDPQQVAEFKTYAENWGKIIPRCGGHLVGYYTPYEGTNDVAWGFIAFAGLTEYERYRERLRNDPEAQDNFDMANTKRIILREERNFVTLVEGTYNLASTLAKTDEQAGPVAVGGSFRRGRTSLFRRPSTDEFP